MGRDTALVLNLESSIALAAVRSLGRRGIRVVGVASSPEAIGLRSRYLAESRVFPWNKERPEAFIDRVLGLAVEVEAGFLLTVSETMMKAFNLHRERAPEGLSFNFPGQELLDLAMDKSRVIEEARSAGLEAPETAVVRCGGDLIEAGRRLRSPLILKYVCVGPRPADERWRFKSRYVASREELSQLAGSMPPLETPLLAQEYALGRYESLGVAMAGGRIAAAFQWAALREYEAGLGAFRLSLPVDRALLAKCGDLLARIGFDGVAEVEFRHDAAAGRFTLMEVNPRLWGGVAFPIALGVDFPWLSFLISTRRRLPEPVEYPVKRYSRNLSGDFRWLVGSVRGKYRDAHPNMRTGRARALFRFLWSLPCRAVLDQESLDDLGPLWASVAARLRRRRPPPADREGPVATSPICRDGRSPAPQAGPPASYPRSPGGRPT